MIGCAIIVAKIAPTPVVMRSDKRYVLHHTGSTKRRRDGALTVDKVLIKKTDLGAGWIALQYSDGSLILANGWLHRAQLDRQQVAKLGETLAAADLASAA